MKILDRAAVLILNLSLLVVFIITPALITAGNHDYYKAQFEKNGIYSRTDENGIERKRTVFYIGGDYQNTAQFENEQLDELSKHIIDYLFGDKESFSLTMDGVLLNGTYQDGVNIFGDTAVSHMKDVKVLMRAALIAAIICAVLLAIALTYIIARRKFTARFLLKYTLIFYGVIVCLILLFLLITLIDGWSILRRYPDAFTDILWENVHHILFPFQPEKFENSFFNDTLTQILTLELFLDAMIIVFTTLLTAFCAWLAAAFAIRKSERNASKNN